MLLKRLAIVALSFLMVPGLGQAAWNNPCITTSDLNSLNPQYVATPLVMYWKAKVKKEVVLVMVKIPDRQEILLNFIQCSRAEIREDRPGQNQGQFECANMERLGDFWVPLADIDEQLDGEASTEFDIDHPTEYFSSRISFHLHEYADGMKWDPTISAALSSMDQLFLGLVGFSIWRLSTKHFVPTSFWSRVRRRGFQGVGIILMIRQAIAAATSAQSEFVEERNQRAAHLETLIQQINERMTMRLDGQDRGQNLEETDGYSALVNSIKKANDDAFNKFCNNKD